MKTHKNLYNKVISLENLILAYKKTRKGKTKKEYVKKFEEELFSSLMELHYKLKHKLTSQSHYKHSFCETPKLVKFLNQISEIELSITL